MLGHSYDHPNLNCIPAATLDFEIAQTAARFDALGAPYTFKVIRPPFLSVNAATQAALAAMGFAVTPNPISATDWDPSRSAAQIPDGIVSALRPGVADPAPRRAGRLARRPGDGRLGAADHRRAPARAATASGRSTPPGRWWPTSSRRPTTPFPAITGTVPYLPLAYAGTPPAPWALVPQPLRLAAAHSPSCSCAGRPARSC